MSFQRGQLDLLGCLISARSALGRRSLDDEIIILGLRLDLAT